MSRMHKRQLKLEPSKFDAHALGKVVEKVSDGAEVVGHVELLEKEPERHKQQSLDDWADQRVDRKHELAFAVHLIIK